MTSRFDDLWDTAANDGAFSPVGVQAPRSPSETALLLEAWYRERAGRIECSLVLDEAKRLIHCLLAEGDVSPRRRRQAGKVVRAIVDTQRSSKRFDQD